MVRLSGFHLFAGISLGIVAVCASVQPAGDPAVTATAQGEPESDGQILASLERGTAAAAGAD